MVKKSMNFLERNSGIHGKRRTKCSHVVMVCCVLVSVVIFSDGYFFDLLVHSYEPGISEI